MPGLSVMVLVFLQVLKRSLAVEGVLSQRGALRSSAADHGGRAVTCSMDTAKSWAASYVSRAGRWKVVVAWVVTGVTGCGWLPVELRGPKLLIVCDGDELVLQAVFQLGSVEVQLRAVLWSDSCTWSRLNSG